MNSCGIFQPLTCRKHLRLFNQFDFGTTQPLFCLSNLTCVLFQPSSSTKMLIWSIFVVIIVRRDSYREAFVVDKFTVSIYCFFKNLLCNWFNGSAKLLKSSKSTTKVEILCKKQVPELLFRIPPLSNKVGCTSLSGTTQEAQSVTNQISLGPQAEFFSKAKQNELQTYVTSIR